MKVAIRPLEVSDAKTSWRWRNNPLVWKYTGFKPDIEITEQIETDWIKRVILEESSKRFAILLDDQEQIKYVGNIQLTNISEDNAQYHIFIGDVEYWGMGIAWRATLLILKYGFSELKLSSIWLEVKEENKSAVNLYKKCGFCFSGYSEKNNLLMSISKKHRSSS